MWGKEEKMMNFRDELKKMRFKKKPRDGKKHDLSTPGRKTVLSAGAVLIAGGLLTAGVLNANTSAYTSSFLSDNSSSRKITNENYDYKMADKHLIVKSASSLKESDGYKKIADGLYLVDKDKELDGSVTTYEDGDVVVADAEDDEVNPEEDVDISADNEEKSETSSENTSDDIVFNSNSKDLTNSSIEDGALELNDNGNNNANDANENVLKTETAQKAEIHESDKTTTLEQPEKNDELVKTETKENQLANYMNSIPFTKEVKVAILDTGVSSDGKRILDGKNFSATGNGTADDNGHGSNISKLILNNTSDLVKILPVKVMDSTGHGTLLSLYQGIEYAIEQNVDVINISLATAAKDTTLIQSAINDAKNAGIKVIAAAGNDNMNVKYYAPANIESVIAVAAVDNKNNRANYSNYGDCIDYAACGEFDGNKGTSFSAAYVTAAAANLLSANEGTDIEKVFNEYAYKPEKLDKKFRGQGIISQDNVIVETEEQYQKEQLKDFDNWKNMSGEEFDKLLKKTNIYKVACFWQHLSEDDKEFAKNLSPEEIATSNVVYEDGTETDYISFLENVDLSNVSLARFTNLNGMCYLYVYDGATCTDNITIYINITADEDVHQNGVALGKNNVGYTYSKKKYFNYYNLNGLMQKKYSTDPLYSYALFAPYFYNPANHAKCIDGNGLSSNKQTSANWGAYSNIGINIYANFFSDLGLTTDQPGGTNASISAYTFYVNEPKFTVDVNPEVDGVAHNSGYDGLTFDVMNSKGNCYSGGQATGDFYSTEISYGSHINITNINCPTGYHATEDSYEYDIYSNKSISAPKITLNKYDVAYNANCPNNELTRTDGHGCTGETKTLEGCTWGKTNYISECGYSIPGYTFDYWTTNSNGTGDIYKPGQSFTKLTDTNGETVTLYAHWSANNYKVTFDLNGGTAQTPIEDKDVSYGTNISLPAGSSAPYKNNKTFIGWSTVKNDVTTSIQSLRAGFSYVNMYDTKTKYMSPPSDIKLYALYSIPVSDVKSVQLRIFQTDNRDANGRPKVKYSSYMNLSKHDDIFYSFSGASKLIQMLENSGGYYTAYDYNRCNLGADIIATDNATNSGIIWTLKLNGKPSSNFDYPPMPEYNTVRTDHYKYVISNTEGKYEYFDTTDSNNLPEGTSYAPKFLDNCPEGYEPLYMTYKLEDSVNASENIIMDKRNNDYDIDAMEINQNVYYSAYYAPIRYKVHFKTVDNEVFIKNKNADNENSQSYIYQDNGLPTMTIAYDQQFNELPSASKTGHTFAGWYRVDDNGNVTDEKINVGDRYKYTSDITVAPKWEKKSYEITYDAVTNGGIFVAGSTNSDTVKYGSTVTVDTSKHMAEKILNRGMADEKVYEFVGWNTKPDATSVKGGVFEDGANVLNDGKMPDHNITVYAIYKRTVKATFYSAYSTTGKPDDIASSGKATFSKDYTYYNRDTSVAVKAPESDHGSLNWSFMGWTTGNNYDSPAVVAKGCKVYIDEDTDFYGLYQKNVTLTYKSNCAAEIDAEQGTVYFNAAPAGKQGNAKKNFEGHFDSSLKSNEANSFVGWVQIIPEPGCPVCGNPTEKGIIGTIDTNVNGCKCKCFYPNSGYKNKRQDGCTCCFMANDAYSIDRDTTVAARWDAYPVISAKDTYISIQEKNDFEKKLIDSAESIDNEDVTTPIVIQNKDEIKKTINSTDENVDVTVIYKTIDSYGNITTESKMLHVVNTASKEAANTSYARFINTKAKNASYNMGGLEENSLWLTKQSYKDALNTALSNADSVKGKKMDTANSYLLGNGKAYKPQYVLKYTNSDIKAIKKYLKNNGYGKFQSSTDMDNGSGILKDYFKTYVEAYEE